MRSPTLLSRRIGGVLFSVALAHASFSGSARAAEPVKAPIEAAAEEALWWGDFGALERQNALYKQPDRFEPDGTSQLALFRDGLGTVFKNHVDNAEVYLQEMDRLTLEWAVQHPESPLAHILHADALVEHGWSYRGGSFAKDVPPEAWKEFHAYLRRAVDYLHAHADVALTDSYAHSVLLQAGRGLGWNSEQMAAIANDGLRRNPDDIELYFDVLASLLPKWGGNARAVDNFINQAAERTRAKHGMAMYARLYSSAAEDEFGQALFEDSFADWSKMKQGYEDLFARFPASPARLNRYAYMACLAKDRDTLLKLFKDIGTRIEARHWGKGKERSVESCRSWATRI